MKSLKGNEIQPDSFDIIGFDMDNTLTLSRMTLDDEMGKLLCQLLTKKKVGIISGSAFNQFQKQVLDHLPCRNDSEEEKNKLLSNFYVLPTIGAALYQYRNGWKQVYERKLTPEERDSIFAAFDKAFAETGFAVEKKIYGEMIEDRGTQVTFSALGSQAPIELKEKWDPERIKRRPLLDKLKELLPDFTVNFGGTTSIDIARKGIDKGFGMKQLASHLNSSIQRIVYVGDGLYPDGNDAAVIPLGIECFQVNSPEDTKKLIHTIIGVAS